MVEGRDQFERCFVSHNIWTKMKILKSLPPQGQASAQRAASAVQATSAPTAAIPPPAAAVGSVTTTAARVVIARGVEGQLMSRRRARALCAPRVLLAVPVLVVAACRQASASRLGGTSRRAHACSKLYIASCT